MLNGRVRRRALAMPGPLMQKLENEDSYRVNEEKNRSNIILNEENERCIENLLWGIRNLKVKM